jgi:predicted NAD/FAD-binding protein
MSTNHEIEALNCMGNKKRIAIIGAGISGLSTAYHLHKEYEVTVFEKNNYFGGHTDTHPLNIDSKQVNIDSGFIIFCREYYPNFCRMLDQLGVQSQATDMSFSVHNRQTHLIYNATNPNKLFCQRRNLLNFGFYRMIFDILRFYNTASQVLKTNDTKTTVAEYLKQHNYSKEFITDHLLPMISALWSATPERVEQFPILHLVDFFSRHGLMKIINRPQWQVVKNGSNSYVKALREQIDVTWRSNALVTEVIRGKTIKVRSQNGNENESQGGNRGRNEDQFDAAVLAVHANSALKILTQPSIDETEILGAIPFERNHVIVHTDESIMHQNKRSWASWNTEVPNDLNQNNQGICTANYWMNSLQGLDLETNVFTSLNSQNKIAEDHVLAERIYHHPVFTAQSVAAQKRKPEIDGKNSTYFTGAYWGWGFHEDGARSAAEICELIREQIK